MTSVPYSPANKGQIFSQQVMPPSEVYWPMITSRKNTGRPPPNRKMKYGMRNAPAEREERVRLRLAQAGTFSVPNPPSQPAGRLCPWDSPGKNTGVGCHGLLKNLPDLGIKPASLKSSALAGFSSVHFSSVTQSCLTLCDPMNCSMPGLPVHHQLPEFTQTHVHRVCDAIQPSHPLSSPSPPAPIPPSIRVFSSESTLCMG